MMPSIPGFAGDLRDDAAAGTRAIMDYQYKSIVSFATLANFIYICLNLD